MADFAEVQRIVSGSTFLNRTGFRFDRREGYRPGVFGARNGPKVSFEALAHEVAHAIHAVLHGQSWRLGIRNFGLEIKSGLEIDGRWYPEPATMQATILECEVFGIQRHILEHCGQEAPASYAAKNAEVLFKFMPDWYFGGRDEEERIRTRVCLIEEAYRTISFSDIELAWQNCLEIVCQLGEPAHAQG